MRSPKALIADLRAWLHADDQELLRRELRFAWGWLTGPLCIGTLALWLGFRYLAGQLLTFSGYPWITGGGITQIQGFGISLINGITYSLPVLLLTGFWWNRRALSMFRPGRIEPLLATPLDPRTLWPALLIAPCTVRVAMTLILPFFRLRYTFSDSPDAASRGPLAMDRPFGIGLAILEWLASDLLPILVSSALGILCTLSLASWWTLTRNLHRFAYAVLILSALVFHIFFSVLYLILWTLLNRTPIFQNSAGIWIAQYVAIAFDWLVTGLIAYFLLRCLRSPKFWEKIRASHDLGSATTQAHAQ